MIRANVAVNSVIAHSKSKFIETRISTALGPWNKE